MANRWPYQPSGECFVLGVRPCSLSSPSEGHCSRPALSHSAGPDSGEQSWEKPCWGSLHLPVYKAQALALSPCPSYAVDGPEPSLAHHKPKPEPIISLPSPAPPCHNRLMSSWTPGCPWSPSPGPLCSLCLGPIVRALSCLLCFTFTPGSPSPVEQPQPYYCLADRLEGIPISFPT